MLRNGGVIVFCEATLPHMDTYTGTDGSGIVRKSSEVTGLAC